MTPNTSDSPEAIRNRNIAAVSPPRNWLNRKEGSISRLPLAGSPSPAPREREGPVAKRWEGEGFSVVVPSAGRRCPDGYPLPRCGRGGIPARPLLQQRLRVDVFGLLHDREGQFRVLDHLRPEL